jgi:hypothetical protein
MDRQTTTESITHNQKPHFFTIATGIKAELIIVAVWIALVGGAYV